MFHFVRRLAVVCVAASTSLLAVPSARAATSQAAAPTALATTGLWHLYSDLDHNYRAQNPGPDSYGNPGVWSLMSSTSWRVDGNYALLPGATRSFNGIQYVTAWYGNADLGAGCPGADPSAKGLPLIVINPTRSDAPTPCGVVRSGQVAVQPAAGRNAIVAWKSPITGGIRISATLTGLAGGGNGVVWFVAKGATTIGYGYLPSGSTRHLDLTTWVAAGQSVYLIVAPRNGNATSDLTGVDLSITPKQLVTDQSFDVPSDLGNAINDCARFVGQSFTAGMTGRLAGVAVSVWSPEAVPMRVAIRPVDASGLPTSTILGEATVVGESPLSQLIVFSRPIWLVAGKQYAIVVDYPTVPQRTLVGNWSGTTQDLYAGGTALTTCPGPSWSRGTSYDLFFRTYIWAASVRHAT